MKNKITVELCDKEFSLLSDESEEYVKSLAKEINQMIQDTAYKNLRISKADAAVLTCLDLCDQNRKLTENNDNMRKTISEYIDEIGDLNRKVAAYERQKSVKGARLSNMDADGPDNTGTSEQVNKDNE